MSESSILSPDIGPGCMIVLNRPERRNAPNPGLVDELSDGSRVRGDARSAGPGDHRRGTCLCGDGHEGGRVRSTRSRRERLAVEDRPGIADLLTQVRPLQQADRRRSQRPRSRRRHGLATACDLIVAAERGDRIGYPEVKRGLIAAIVLHDLVRQAGERRAPWLALTGEPIAGGASGTVGTDQPRGRAGTCADEAIARGNPDRKRPACDRDDQAVARRTSNAAADLRGSAAILATIRCPTKRAKASALLEERPPGWASSEPTEV